MNPLSMENIDSSLPIELFSVADAYRDVAKLVSESHPKDNTKLVIQKPKTGFARVCSFEKPEHPTSITEPVNKLYRNYLTQIDHLLTEENKISEDEIVRLSNLQNTLASSSIDLNCIDPAVLAPNVDKVHVVTRNFRRRPSREVNDFNAEKQDEQKQAAIVDEIVEDGQSEVVFEYILPECKNSASPPEDISSHAFVLEKNCNLSDNGLNGRLTDNKLPQQKKYDFIDSIVFKQSEIPVCFSEVSESADLIEDSPQGEYWQEEELVQNNMKIDSFHDLSEPVINPLLNFPPRKNIEFTSNNVEIQIKTPYLSFNDSCSESEPFLSDAGYMELESGFKFTSEETDGIEKVDLGSNNPLVSENTTPVDCNSKRQEVNNAANDSVANESIWCISQENVAKRKQMDDVLNIGQILNPEFVAYDTEEANSKSEICIVDFGASNSLDHSELFSSNKYIAKAIPLGQNENVGMSTINKNSDPKGEIKLRKRSAGKKSTLQRCDAVEFSNDSTETLMENESPIMRRKVESRNMLKQRPLFRLSTYEERFSNTESMPPDESVPHASTDSKKLRSRRHTFQESSKVLVPIPANCGIKSSVTNLTEIPVSKAISQSSHQKQTSKNFTVETVPVFSIDTYINRCSIVDFKRKKGEEDKQSLELINNNLVHPSNEDGRSVFLKNIPNSQDARPKQYRSPMNRKWPLVSNLNSQGRSSIDNDVIYGTIEIEPKLRKHGSEIIKRRKSLNYFETIHKPEIKRSRDLLKNFEENSDKKEKLKYETILFQGKDENAGNLFEKNTNNPDVEFYESFLHILRGNQVPIFNRSFSVDYVYQ